jgi:HAD superfamily hydrolase (TIGR01484 family)
MINFFLIDIDGCLNNGRNKKPNNVKLGKIKNLFASKKDLFSFTLCTGRGTGYAKLYAQTLGCTNPVVCENGGLIYYPSKDDIIVNPFITPQDIKNLKELDKALKNNLSEIYPSYKKENKKKTMISLNPPDNQNLSEFFDHISLFIKNYHDAFSITRSSSAVDISPKNINKNKGAELLLKEVNIDYQNVCGIGDSLNDISVLQKVGFPACPNNAESSIKEICKYVASKKYEDGVLEIISHLL